MQPNAAISYPFIERFKGRQAAFTHPLAPALKGGGSKKEWRFFAPRGQKISKPRSPLSLALRAAEGAGGENQKNRGFSAPVGAENPRNSLPPLSILGRGAGGEGQPPRILLLADDLTGAADSGVQFASVGLTSVLAMEPGSAAQTEVWVLSSDSRGLPEGEAASAQRAWLAGLAQTDFSLVYKKIDSTLRGHPAAELRALLDWMGTPQPVLIAPAFPAQGRTTLGGVVHVQGRPLGQTSFAAEAGTGDLRAVFGPSATLLPLETVRRGEDALRVLFAHDARLWIADAETGADLGRLARAALRAGLRCFCGSAGLAAALAEELGTGNSPAQLSALPRSGAPPLAVVGSLHAASAVQVEAARRLGIQVVTPPTAFFTEIGSVGMAETAVLLAAELAAGRPVILTTTNLSFLSASVSPWLNSDLSTKLAQTAALALQSAPAGSLFLTGGDTARAVCRALNCTRLRLCGEVEPGMPWSQMVDGRFPGLPVITKAGGFGGEASLAAALQYLSEHHF